MIGSHFPVLWGTRGTHTKKPWVATQASWRPREGRQVASLGLASPGGLYPQALLPELNAYENPSWSFCFIYWVCLCRLVYAHLTPAKVTQKEETSVKKTPPEDPARRHFLNQGEMGEGLAHHGCSYPWAFSMETSVYYKAVGLFAGVGAVSQLASNLAQTTLPSCSSMWVS